MKRLYLLLLVFLVAFTLVLTACGDEEAETSTTAAPISSTPADSTVTSSASVSSSNTPVIELPVGDKLTSGSVALTDIAISYEDTREFDQVVRAIGDLKNDFKTVTGKDPAAGAKVSILVGTVGKNQTIDALIENGTIDLSAIKGKWEGYHLGVYTGIGSAEKTVVIAGNDMRGTIFGIYTLSELIGVSPWHWWADVPTEKNTSLSLSVESLTVSTYPDVKYRGIFINDEEASAVWAKMYENKTDSQGSPNPYVYGKMFELLLRLKANTLWPAMHATSDAFNGIVDPETGISYNATLANEYGIVMGSSHCEMLLCNNETEWEPWCIANQDKYDIIKINNSWRDSYDYTVNAEAMNAYWEDRVAANYRYENIYTIGLRGLHDSEILCSGLSDKSWASKAAVVQMAVEAQIAILEKYEDIYEKETGVRREFATCFCPYKEAAEYYKYDLSLPEDCIIIYADDNYGYVRQYPTNTEKDTYAGFGVYYHVSYRGVPRSYLWIDSMPLSLMYEEMHKSYTAGSDDLWILNVGDLKPAEFSISFFLDLAFKESSISGDDLEAWMQEFFIETFDLTKEDAELLSYLHSDFLQIAIAYRADFQGYHEGTEYSIFDFGDEAEITIRNMKILVEQATAIYDKLPENRRDSYFEIVLYRMRATLFTLQKNIYMQKNQAYLAQGRFASVNAYAALSEEAYKNILNDLNTYNSLQNGKWRGIMDPYITDNGSPVITGAPKVTYLSMALAEDGIGTAVEGQTGTAAVTLTFDSIAKNFRFIDIFNKGLTPTEATVTTTTAVFLSNEKSITLPYTDNGNTRTYTIKIDVETRLFITIDWAKLSSSQNLTLTVSDSFDHSYTYTLFATVQTVFPELEDVKGYYETNGFISMEAEHYTDNVTVDGMAWKPVPNLGVSGDSMKCYPDHSADHTRIDEDYETASPYLEYRFYITEPGTFSGVCYRIPTLNEGNTDDLVHKTCRIAYAFDNNAIDYFRGTSLVDTNGGSAWSNMVRHNYEAKTFTVTFTTAGWHTLRVYMADQGTAFDKIVLRRNTVSEIASRLGHPETFNTIQSFVPTRAVAPTFTLSEVPFKDSEGKTEFLFDFTTNTTPDSGYTAVTPSTESAKGNYYEWTEGFSSLKGIIRSGSNISLRDGSIIYSSTKATFNVITEKKGTYIVTVVIGDRGTGGNAVSGMSVSVGDTVYLENLSLAAGRTEEHAFVVDVTGDSLPLTFTGSWVIAAIEIHPYTESKAPTAPASPDANGDVILEAEWALENTEHFKSTVSSDGNNFRFMYTGGRKNGAVYFGPNANQQFSSTAPSSAKTAKLNFAVNLKAGTYSVFAYVKCGEDNDDSMITLLDNGQAQVANDFKNTGGVYKAVRIATFTVDADGTHTLTVFGREDGLAIDTIIITQKSIWTE